jgi:hypothetical protein
LTRTSSRFNRPDEKNGAGSDGQHADHHEHPGAGPTPVHTPDAERTVNGSDREQSDADERKQQTNHDYRRIEFTRP